MTPPSDQGTGRPLGMPGGPSDVSLTSTGPAAYIRPGRTTGWWGMWGFIATESVLFALLFFVYFYFRAGLAEWPPAGLPLPDLKSAGIRTGLLVASSVTMVWANRALANSDRPMKCAVWLWATLVLSAFFLTGHIQEQFHLFSELAPSETAYGSTFVTILNVDIAHVIIGMMILAFLLVQVLRGRFSRRRYGIVAIGGLYWHFSVVVSVAVYLVLYLPPHFLRGP